MPPSRRRISEDVPSLVEAFYGLRADYAAARDNQFLRRRNVPLSGAGADYHYRSEAHYLRIMEYARDMDRSDCVVGQMVDRASCNIVQEGFSLDATTEDDAINKDNKARWTAWSEDEDECDVSGEMTFHDMEQLICRQPFIDGDICALPLTSGALQLVEAHRLRTPRNTKRNVVHGVLLDSSRRRLEYWFTKDPIDPMKTVTKVGDIKPIKARNADGEKQVFHIFYPKRVTQTRGVSALAPIFDLAGMFEDINFAKLVQAQSVSSFAILRERAQGSVGGTSQPFGALESTTLADGSTRTIEGIGPGMNVTAAPGETIKGFSPNIPNAEYFDHVKLILTLIGINIGLPLVLSTLDASQTNFSGWRGAVDQARLNFRAHQLALIRKFHRRVYRWKVRQWMHEDPALRRAAEKGLDIFAHKWNTPGWKYIEPKKDAEADALRLQHRLTSPRRLHAEQGRDWDDIVRETVEDNGKAVRAAMQTAAEINGEFKDSKDPVGWRDLLNLEQARPQPDAPPKPGDDDDEK